MAKIKQVDVDTATLVFENGGQVYYRTDKKHMPWTAWQSYTSPAMDEEWAVQWSKVVYVWGVAVE